MRISWGAFRGELPRLEAHLLPDGNAQIARNIDLNRAALDPYNTPLQTATLVKQGEIKAIYRYPQSLDSDSQYWFHFLTDADIVRGPVASDTLERTYITQPGVHPKVTDASLATGGPDYPTVMRDLGVPGPTGAAVITLDGAAVGDPTSILVSYSFVNSYGEEGPLAPASDIVQFYAGMTLNIITMDGNPGGTWNVQSRRIYVSQTDSAGTTGFRFWAELAVGTTSYGAVLNMELLVEDAPAPSPVPPPAGLTCLRAHPNGFMVGLADNKFCRSDVYKPYAWPPTFQEPLTGGPVGLEIVAQTTVIGTKNGCYIAVGADPNYQSVELLKDGQPLASKRSMKLMHIGVVYACPDGLVRVGAGGESELVTEGIYTQQQWQALNPSSMHACVHDKRYYCWYDTGTTRGGLIFDFNEGIGVVATDVYATAAYSDPRRNAMFITLPNQLGLYKWNAGLTKMTLTWRSKKFSFPNDTIFGAARIVGAGAMTLNGYADGELVISRPLSGTGVYRFKPRRGQEWVFEILGAGRLTEVHVGATVAEVVIPNG